MSNSANPGNPGYKNTPQNVDKVPEDHQALEQVRHRLNNLTQSIETVLTRSFLNPSEAPKDGSGIPSWYINILSFCLLTPRSNIGIGPTSTRRKEP